MKTQISAIVNSHAQNPEGTWPDLNEKLAELFEAESEKKIETAYKRGYLDGSIKGIEVASK